MKSIFLNIGHGFNDELLNKFKEQLEKRMHVITFNRVSENVEAINAIEEQGAIFYFETGICRKNQNYTRAFCNVISLLTYKPSAVYLMPHAPRELVRALKKHWPKIDIYHFEYDKMKPAEKIN